LSTPELIVVPATLAQATVEMAGLVHARARAVAEARILRDGAAAFPAMIELIDAARSCVRFENFIFAGDATGEMFASALTRAAKRGVEVRVLYDPVGTMMVKGGSVARMLTRHCGVVAQPFRPLSFLQPWSWSRLRHRDHRKTLAVDGEAAVVGGLCISDNWSASSRGGKGWRDTGLLVRGPVAADLEAAFDAMWRRADEQGRLSAAESVTDSPPPAALIAADEPGKRYVSALYQWLAERARRTLEITDAYLVAPRQILSAFESAARRGVEVRLLLPGSNNHPLAGAAARHIYAPLLDAGVGIWEWDGVMLHAKTAVVDGEVTMIGSSNLDPLSMSRNYELNLVIADEATGAAMREMFAADLREATPIDADVWRRRPAWKRALETTASLFAADL
jgi:cardiolipin synthase A/B